MKLQGCCKTLRLYPNSFEKFSKTIAPDPDNTGGGKMFKKSLLCLLTIILMVCVTSCTKRSATPELTVYSYDSFAGNWGPGQDLVQEFTEKTGIKVNLIGCGAASEVYGKFVFEKEKTKADIIIGLSDSINVDEKLFYQWEPQCKSDLIPYDSDCLIPFDYGIYAFLKNNTYPSDLKPTCLEDLIKPEYKNKFILIDPRTSSVGLGLLKWTILAFGEEKALNWWYLACKNALTTAESWSSAYGIFTEGEAPFVISYTTSPAYHKIFEDNYSIEALEFADGHIVTTEYLAITAQSKMKEEAKLFCEYILTEGQEKIALANTMFPANRTTSIPTELNNSLQPKEIPDSLNFSANQHQYLEKWAESIAKI